MARTALSAGQVDTAATLFEQALAASPADVEATIGFGDTLVRQGRPQEASDIYARVLGAGGAAAHLGYARAMIGLNRPEVALEHLTRARALSPADPLILSTLGVAYDMTGQHALAAETYRIGLVFAPDDQALRSNLGLSLALSGQPEQGITMLQEIAEAPGADKRARQNLALAYALNGDMLAAERLSRLDLDERDVRNNMAIFTALRGHDSATTAAALAPVSATPAPLPPRVPAPKRSERAPIKLSAVALNAGDLAVGASPAGSWFLNLGRADSGEATARRWASLQQEAKSNLGGLKKLAGAGTGPEPLLVGPVADEAAGKSLCAKIRRLAPDCSPIKL
jgi:Flp pilus assembly protein TadD